MPDEGNAEAFENDAMDTAYSYEMGHQEMEEGPDIDEIQSSANNEVEIEDLSEVPNQSSAAIGQSNLASESSSSSTNERQAENQQQIQSISSGTGNGNGNEAGTSSLSPATISQWRQSPSASTSRQQTQHLTLMGQSFQDEASDDRIVPSTPTLYRARNDTFSEIVSSPAQVPLAAARFTFGESSTSVQNRPLTGMDDTRIDLSEEHVATTGQTVPNLPQQTQQSSENLINDSTSASTSSTSSSISTVIQQDVDQPVLGSSTNIQEESQVPDISVTTDEGKNN